MCGNDKVIFKIKSEMRTKLFLFILLIIFIFNTVAGQGDVNEKKVAKKELINLKAGGFRGIWYMNQPSNDKYVYKYSGGLGTYCAKHQPFAIYSEEADKTFFCFGGTDEENSTLYHNVSYFNHATGEVANPTIVLDKETNDAHDNPVISMDDEGYIWIFSTAHGTSRSSYISKSVNPYDISHFELVEATEIVDDKVQPLDNFSYFQIWHSENKGFMAFYTKYNNKGHRVIGFNTSIDGIHWNEWEVIAHIQKGHYGISGEYEGNFSIAFNYHPEEGGLNYRTNLYYLQTTDFGKNWYNASGEKVDLPLTEVDNKALVKNYENRRMNCYLKDLNFDNNGNPLILVLTSLGYQSGPRNDPRRWTVFHFKEGKWENQIITTSDNNYDMGSIYVDEDNVWQLIAPVVPGPQQYNTGGEVAIWVNHNDGYGWRKKLQVTQHSRRNHSYVRRPVNAHHDFYALWADGHGRKPSESNLYFCNKEGKVYLLPRDIIWNMSIFKPKLLYGE
jgi:hypothetical protein